jgi:hypothetical protein
MVKYFVLATYWRLSHILKGQEEKVCITQNPRERTLRLPVKEL